jgi:hypothetical protein
MVLYQYYPDSDSFNGIGLRPEDRHVIKIRHDNQPVSLEWQPISVRGFSDNPGVEGDFPSLSDYNEIPVFSHRAWSVLYPLIGYCCEALPIVHPSGDQYYIVHVMDEIDCLDESRSEVKRYSDGGIMKVTKYAIRTDAVKGTHIFKLPRKIGGTLLVDNMFRELVEAHGLKGLLFVPLPMKE